MKIEFLALLGGYSQIFMVQYRGEMVTDFLEASFLITWEDSTTTKGFIDIAFSDLVDNVDNSDAFKNIDNNKVVLWIKNELKDIPKSKRNREWSRRISPDVLKLWLKNEQ